MDKDPFAFLQDEEEEDNNNHFQEEQQPSCLRIDDDLKQIDLRIDDLLFTENGHKMRHLLKYLKNNKQFNQKYKSYRMELRISIFSDHVNLESLDNNRLYAVMHILQLTKTQISKLKIYISASSDMQPEDILDPLPLMNVISNMFNVLHEGICKYKLEDIGLHWIVSNDAIYEIFTHGITQLLSIKPNEIKQHQKELTMFLGFSPEWLKMYANLFLLYILCLLFFYGRR